MKRLSSCKLLRVGALGASIGALALAGCGGGGGGGMGTNGSLTVAMVDAPALNISALNVTIDKVEANVNGNWMAIATTPQTFNLLSLVKNEKILGSATLPAGHYTQVRFFPTAATVTDATGTHSVTIPSGVRTGVKVNVDYDITPNVVTTILLDFNVQKSLVRQGNGQYLLQPVIPAVVKVLSGTISGVVTSSGNPVQGATVTATYTTGTNYPLGTAVNTGLSQADGSFKIWALLPGTYTVTASFTDAGGTTTTATQTGVVVTANADSSVGTLALQ